MHLDIRKVHSIQIDIPFGHSTTSLDIPGAIRVEVVSPRSVDEATDPDAIIKHALDHPIGSPGLEQIARSDRKVALIIDDITRETPTRMILPHVLERLTAGGLPSENIKIVIALGTHRPMNQTEIKHKVGAAVMNEVEIINIPSSDKSQMVYLGTSTNGIPAWINTIVAASDIRVGVGSIVPHPDVGYGGGAKIILPGVCSDRTVDAFHARSAAVHANLLGTVEGPMRNDLEQFVNERVGLEFVLNAILTRDGRLYRCVAGHAIQAHRAGVRIAQQVYGVPVGGRHSLVIANAFPAQLDLWQSSKALWSGELLTSDGGTLILLAPCDEGIGVHPSYVDYIGRDPDALQKELDTGRAKDPNACAGAIQIGRMKRRIKPGLVSPGLSRIDADRMGFAYYDSVEDAIAAETDLSEAHMSIGVLTHGGSTLPLHIG